MSWLKDRWEELNAQVKMGDNRTASTVRAARKPAAPAQTMRANTNQPGWSVRKPQPAPLTTQQRISQSYGPTGFTGLKNYAKDMLFDNNSEADRIKRYAATGLNESYDQEQARKTKEAQASNDKLGTIHQVMKSLPAGAGFLAKPPGAIGQMQGRTAKMVNEIDNPLLRTGAKLVSAPLGGLMTTKQADTNIKTGRGLNERIDNKMQQSAFGDRADDNKYVTGAGKMFGQLGGQIATGGLGTVAIGSQMAADEANKAEAAGKSNTYSTLTGFGQGGIGALSEKYGVDKFIPGKGNVAGNFVTRMGKRIFTEGAQEAQQQFTQNYIANKAYNPNQSLKEGVLESALMGGLAGGAMSPAVDIMNRPTAPKPTTSLVAPKPEPTRTRLRPEEARIWSDYQETLYKGNRMPAQVVNETHNKARQIADSLGVDIITGSPDEIAGRMNPLLEQSMAFQKEPTTSLVRPRALNQSGYIQLPGGQDTQLNDTELGVLNYLNNKPVQEGSATQGEGNALPTELSAGKRQSYLDKMKKMVTPLNEGGYIAGPLALDFNKAKAKGLVFDGVDGKPRFEVSDEGAKLKNDYDLLNESESFVGNVLEHPELYKQYPGMKNVPIEIRPGLKANAALDQKSGTMLLNPKLLEKIDTKSGDTSKITRKQVMDLLKKQGYTQQQLASETKGISTQELINSTLTQEEINQLSGLENPEQATRFKGGSESIILHELQHEIQGLEGFAGGDDASRGFDKYQKSAGEAEARAVASRMNMPMSERYVKPEGETFYHGTTEKWQGDEPRFPLYTTPNKKYAQVFADSTAASSIGKSGIKKADGSMVREFKLNPKARTLDATDPKVRAMLDKEYFGKYSMSDKFYPGKNGHLDWTEGENLAEFIAEKKLPYDAIKLDEGGGGVDPQFGVMVDDKGTSVLALNKNAISPNQPRSTFYDSLDVPKQDLIIRNGDGKAMSLGGKKSLKDRLGIKPLNEGGYIQLGAPEPKKLSQDIKDQFSKQGSFGRDAMDRLEANKISKGDLERAGVIFDPKQVKKIAQTLPEFKANPVMTYRKGDYSYTDAGYGRYPVPEKARSGVFEFKHSRGTMRLNPEALFGKEMARKLAQTAKDGEQVDFRDTMKASGNRLFTYEQTPDKPLASAVQPKPTIKSVDPLDSLKAEARKYKSAEEFVKAYESKTRSEYTDRFNKSLELLPEKPRVVKKGITKRSAEVGNTISKRADAQVVENVDAGLAVMREASNKDQSLTGRWMDAVKTKNVPDQYKRYDVIDGKVKTSFVDMSPEESRTFYEKNRPLFQDGTLLYENDRIYSNTPKINKEQLTSLYNENNGIIDGNVYDNNTSRTQGVGQKTGSLQKKAGAKQTSQNTRPVQSTRLLAPQPPKSPPVQKVETPFQKDLQAAGLAPKKSKGLVVSETKPLNGQKIQKVRTAPGKVEQRVVQDRSDEIADAIGVPAKDRVPTTDSQRVERVDTAAQRGLENIENNPEIIRQAAAPSTLKDKTKRRTFEEATKKYLGGTRSAEIERQATIANLNKEFKLNDKEKINAIISRDDPSVPALNEKVMRYNDRFKQLTDVAYKSYTDQGVKMGYVSSYLPRIYKNPTTGQEVDLPEFKALIQGSKRMKGREADKVAVDWLVEKDPTKLLERYYKSMDNAVAGRRYMKDLEDNGLVVASTEPVRGMRPVIAEGLQTDGKVFYAQKDVAHKLNELFGSKEATNLVEKTLEKGAGVNSLFQSFVLSGGVPNTPINAFGMMQLLKEGMALHPVKAGRAFFGGGLSKSYANKVFTAKKDVMKLMAQNDLDIRVNLEQTGKWGNRRIRDAFKNEGKAAGLNQAWNEFTNDATFGRFMPMLEVLHFENVYKHQLKGGLIRKPKSSAEAARIAADSTKNFYGKTSVYKTSTRSKAVDDAAGALLFAPRFRESMVNFWVKNAKALVPTNYGKAEYRDNQKFMVASAVMYAAMTMLNEAMNGARMDENPDGKKDKLIMPASVAGKFGIDTNGKDIAVPFLPSIATVPRNLASLGANLATGKFNEAGKNAKAFASMPVKTVGDILTNEDYFGNKIVQDDSSPLQKFTQAASYVASSNMQPWVREGLNAKGQNLSKETKKTWGIKEKSKFEALSNAGELPLRFYKPDTYRYGENWTPKGGKDEKFDFKQQRERAALGGEIKNISKTLKLNKRQDELFKSLSSVEFNDDGTLKEDNNPFYKSQRYTALQDDGVFEAMKQKSKLNAKLNGKPVDPIFSDDLAPDQRRVLLWKKTLPPGTSDPTVKKLYEQDWYQEYRNKESAYFEGKKAWNKKMGYKEATPNTNEYPMASKDVEDAQNAYFALPKGTGARSSFIRNNPDVWNKMIAFWDSKDAWTNGERSKLGLGDVEDEYASTSGSKGGKRGGKGSKGGSKYDYTKNLFASGSDSASTSKQLRAILEKAMSGKS